MLQQLYRLKSPIAILQLFTYIAKNVGHDNMYKH